MTQRDFLHRYVSDARALMLRFMTPNSCIAASRLTIECLRLMGFESYALPVTWLVQSHERKRAYTSGVFADLRPEQLARLNVTEGQYSRIPDGYHDGHVVVGVRGPGPGMMIDAAFDQCFVDLGLKFQPQMVYVPSPVFKRRKLLGKKVVAELVVEEQNEHLEVQYLFTDNYKFIDTPAWNDEGLPLLARSILTQFGVEPRA